MKKLLFAIVCLIASFTFASCGGSTPADEAAKCIELLKNKDYEGFVETIALKGETTEEIDQQKQFYLGMLQSKAAKTFDKKGGIDSYTLVSEEIAEDGNSAKVEYEITYGDGSKDSTKFNMVKVDGDWKQEIKK
jgi:hypothetical protein